MSAVYLEKVLIRCWLALGINKDGTTKMRNQRNEKNEKTGVVQKKWREQRKAGKVQQVVEGGGVQVGICERPSNFALVGRPKSLFPGALIGPKSLFCFTLIACNFL